MSASSVLNFWFNELKPEQWWKKDIEIDKDIQERFGSTHSMAKKCELDNWRDSIEGRLAEIIVLDQFSRNIFRNSPAAFENDSLALALAQEAIKVYKCDQLTIPELTFLYIPFMHSESLSIQNKSMELHSKEGMEARLPWAFKHHSIIEKFGRFPHRNIILSRKSTDEEILFLKLPGSSF